MAKTLNFKFRLCVFMAVLFILVITCSFTVFIYGDQTVVTPSTSHVNSSSVQGQKLHMRILCLILTTASGATKMAAVKETWSKRCDKRLFIYDHSQKIATSDETVVVPVDAGRNHLTAKVRGALKYVYTTYNNTFDWILKCDDDTYIVMENLRYLLSNTSPDEASYLGFILKYPGQSIYMSGGAGYVISSRAFHVLVHKGFELKDCRTDGGAEDMVIATCLRASGVSALNSLDNDKKDTFHADSIYNHVKANSSSLWLKYFEWKHRANPWGRLCCSRYSISFHYISPKEMYLLEQLLYNTSVHGLYKQRRNSIFRPVKISWSTGQFS